MTNVAYCKYCNSDQSDKPGGDIAMHDKLTITVTKTADGVRDYLQIMSADMLSLNVVLVADQIVVEDHRKEEKRGKPAKAKP